MLIGIRPTNDFAYKKTFGTIANTLALISLLNAILRLRIPIVEVTIVNPYNNVFYWCLSRIPIVLWAFLVASAIQLLCLGLLLFESHQPTSKYLPKQGEPTQVRKTSNGDVE